MREPPDHVHDAHGVHRSTVEAGHTRALGSIFGNVEVTRRAYLHRGSEAAPGLRQEWYRDYVLALDAEPLAFVESAVGLGSVEAAASIRSALSY